MPATRHVLERDELTLPNDRDAIADALDLGQNVRREEDRPSLPTQVVQQLLERPLHQRVESFGRLVENRDRRIVLERLDDAYLLGIPRE